MYREQLSARERMAKYRETKSLTFQQLSKESGVSSDLLYMVEKGAITHPNIVARIQAVYGLSDEEAEELLPENRRIHSGIYDPDRYVDPIDLKSNGGKQI